MVVLYILLAGALLLVPLGSMSQCGRMERFLLLQQWYVAYNGWIANGDLYHVIRAQYRIFKA